MSTVERYVELHPISRALAARAASVFPDGVTHDMRYTEPFPLYVSRASGSHKTDVDGNNLIDYVMGHGALLLGHNHPDIVAGVEQQLSRGTHFGASHEAEIRWGELVQQLVPSAERVRFTSSGTEATMMALRLARAFSGRENVVRFREHFHGWNDSVTGQPGSEGTVPQAAGLPAGILGASIVIPQNDTDALERTLRDEGETIAAVILEPTGAHFGTDPMALDFVRAARDLSTRHSVLLVFDEVITGFRVSPGGAQQSYGITPDLTTMAKIVAGGLPGGCVAGRADVLDQIRMGPAQRISHPGTFNANPLSAAAGATCLSLIGDGTHQERAASTAARLARDMNKALLEESMKGCVYGYSSMLHIVIGEGVPPPDGYRFGGAPPDAMPTMARDVGPALLLAMINEGVHLMGSSMMVSSAHTDEDATATVQAFRRALVALLDDGLVGRA